MKDSLPSLILYIVAGALAIIGKATGSEMLLLVTKPMVVPAIFYYYLQTKSRNVNALFLVGLWAFFIADMIMILMPRTGILYIMACGMVSYLVMVYFALKDCKPIRIGSFNILFFGVTTLLLGYVILEIVNLDVPIILNNYAFHVAYGAILLLLVAVSTFNYLTNNTTAFLYLCAMALCMMVSDLFYCIDKFVYKMPVIDNINLLSQFMSYFFMVRYFNTRRAVYAEIEKA
jgi:hypothetical protein